MSHRSDCPDRWEAEREGSRAQEWGRSRSANPYESIWHDEGCPEAADAWRSGYRRAEMREEEQREEEAARHRAEMRRAELQAEEDAYYDYPHQRAQEPSQYDEADYIASECGSTGHPRYEGADQFGARCYCGRVRYLDVTP